MTVDTVYIKFLMFYTDLAVDILLYISQKYWSVWKHTWLAYNLTNNIVLDMCQLFNNVGSVMKMVMLGSPMFYTANLQTKFSYIFPCLLFYYNKSYQEAMKWIHLLSQCITILYSSSDTVVMLSVSNINILCRNAVVKRGLITFYHIQNSKP